MANAHSWASRILYFALRRSNKKRVLLPQHWFGTPICMAAVSLFWNTNMHGRRFIVLEHQYAWPPFYCFGTPTCMAAVSLFWNTNMHGLRDVMWKRSTDENLYYDQGYNDIGSCHSSRISKHSPSVIFSWATVANKSATNSLLVTAVMWN